MSLRFASLNSGSNGNCYYIENDNDALLVDAGLICKETERRLRSLNRSMHQVKAILITHEHIDHVRGLDLLARKYDIPVYINRPTYEQLRISEKLQNIHWLDDVQELNIGSLVVYPFAKHHDAAMPVSFRVKCGNISVGVFTDIGTVCENLTHHFSHCHAAFLESNYDVEMLMNGSYPYYLKQRIHGDKGHLSNDQAMELFLKHRPSYMRHLLLSHLSKENNSPELALQFFNQQNTGVHVSVASRYQPSELYSLFETEQKKTAPTISVQLNLFQNGG